ncbi:mechanosensitive ion channel family protein [Micromonospora sp. DT229]|uniref:mechanosensitive ion channel family protein n=1 Tax=Micromonospora sp. DT229 TaxID=3393430 RepID=UPI003CECBF8D
MRENFGDAVGDTLRSILLFLPRAVAFVAILVAGWLIAKAVLKLVDRLLERVGFDRAVERGGIRRALANSRYDASDIVARLAYYGVLLLTLYLAFGIWGPNPISDLIAGVIAWLPRAFVAIVIVVVAAAIASAVKDIISGALGGLSYGRLLATIASAFILGLGIIAALNQIGVATAVTTPVLIAVLATVGGILVVGVGGGLVRPMQSRWESWLFRAEQESRTIAEHARAYSATRREAEQRPTAPVRTESAAPGYAEPAVAVHPDPVHPDPATPAHTDPVTPAAGVPTEPTFSAPPATSPTTSAATDTAASRGDRAGEVGAYDDPEATQVVSLPGRDSDPTTPLPRQDDPEATQVTTSAPEVPTQRTADDSESTIILPRPDDETRR